MYTFGHIVLHNLRVYYELTIWPAASWPDAMTAQVVEHSTGIAEVMGSNPVQAWIVFRLKFHNFFKLYV